MGGSNSVLNVESHVWPKAESHEIYTTVFERSISLVSYEPNEFLSFGKLDLNYFEKNFPGEFVLEKKGINYYDGKRKKYSDEVLEKCCLDNDTYKTINDGLRTCPVDTQTFNSNVCDDIMYNTCFEKNISNKNCTLWIRNVAQYYKIKYFNKVKAFVSKEENRNHPFTQIFFESLRDYNNASNNYNFIVDEIIDSYSNSIKFKEYKCAFPPNYILEQEKDNNSTPRECWYKECVLSPLYKLKTENIYKKKICNTQICDIKIDSININANDIIIKCLNKYNNKKITNLSDNIPFKLDNEDLFYVPGFINTALPFFIIFLFLFF